MEKQAKETAITLSLKLLNICSDVGANFNTHRKYNRKLKVKMNIYLSKLKNLTKEKLENIVSYTADRSKITIIRGIFSGLVESKSVRMQVERLPNTTQ